MSGNTARNNVRRIPTVLCYDVEDLVAPESDDVALWLAQILSEYGLKGSFMVVGEKARLWEHRNRRDVIEAIQKHDVAFHSTWHSVHPSTTEICLDRNFAEGMEDLWTWDREGWRDAERILGRPLLGWARTGSSWSPSVMGLMGRMGRAYAYSLVRLPGHNVCWYAGCLGFYGEGVGGFDEMLYSDLLFQSKLDSVNRQVDAYMSSERRGAQWLCFFMCHPTRVISTRFWDEVNFAKGANPPRALWKPAPQHDRSLIPTMQANYRRLCDALSKDDRMEIVGWGDLIHRYDAQREFAGHAELMEHARRIADEGKVLFTDFFTAGELLLMLCQAARSPQERYIRPTVYGPLTTPPVTAAGEMDASDVREAAGFVLEASGNGYLPASVTVGACSVGLGTYLVALARALVGRARVSGPSDAPYPEAAEDVAREAAKAIPNWIIHPDAMDLSCLLEQTRLQCWTLKPAWPCEAVGQSITPPVVGQ